MTSLLGYGQVTNIHHTWIWFWFWTEIFCFWVGVRGRDLVEISCSWSFLFSFFHCSCIHLLALLLRIMLSLAVYRIYTSILFHGSLLHVLFNMMALVPLGSELERIMGSVRLLYVTLLLATSNAIFHVLIALLVANNPFRQYENLMNVCAIGFSGILFSMIVIETSLSGVQSRRLVCIQFYTAEVLTT